jgi:hypothetical protein
MQGNHHAREHPLVATACPAMVRGGVPARAAAPAAQNTAARRRTRCSGARLAKTMSLRAPRDHKEVRGTNERARGALEGHGQRGGAHGGHGEVAVARNGSLDDSGQTGCCKGTQEMRQ